MRFWGKCDCSSTVIGWNMIPSMQQYLTPVACIVNDIFVKSLDVIFRGSAHDSDVTATSGHQLLLTKSIGCSSMVLFYHIPLGTKELFNCDWYLVIIFTTTLQKKQYGGWPMPVTFKCPLSNQPIRVSMMAIFPEEFILLLGKAVPISCRQGKCSKLNV